MDYAPSKMWFALYTRPRHEFKAKEIISSSGIENFMPVRTFKRKWSDRYKLITEPLLKGYIFIYASEKERLEAVTIDSVINTVSFSGKPAVIPEWQIDSLKKIIEHEKEVTISDRIPVGTKVKIISGPMEGVIGVVEQNTNNEQLISLSIDIINRTVSLILPGSSVTRILEN